MEQATWNSIEQLRKTNRAIYEAIEELVGESKEAEDPTLVLMQKFYKRHPILARAVHREILRIDLLIYDHSAELADEPCE